MVGKLPHKRATLSCIRKKRKNPLRPFLRDRSAGENCLTNTLSRKHGLPSKINSLETLTISKSPSNKSGTVQHVYSSLLFSSSNVSRRGDIPLDMPQDYMAVDCEILITPKPSLAPSGKKIDHRPVVQIRSPFSVRVGS